MTLAGDPLPSQTTISSLPDPTTIALGDDPAIVAADSCDLPVPHAGYHWDQSTRRFFEGWYYRITLPQIQQGFAFMYSIEDPAGGQQHSGGSAQILGPDDIHQWRTFPKVDQFWADPDRLALGHWGQMQNLGHHLAAQYLDPRDFFTYIRSGYQATATLNQGIFTNPITGSTTRWLYQIEPIYTYGFPDPEATMGLLSYLPVFEPGWQILMAHGWAKGWIEWQDQRYCFDRAPAYGEKNWGGAFPSKWFWLNCNSFAGWPDLALTSAGAKRGVLWWEEEVAMIALHWQDRYLTWLPETSSLSWSVLPWGSWRVAAKRSDFEITLEGQTDFSGTPLLAPTWDGLCYACRDTLRGQIHLKLWRIEGQVRVLELEAYSDLGGLETGGGPWPGLWEGSCGSL